MRFRINNIDLCEAHKRFERAGRYLPVSGFRLGRFQTFNRASGTIKRVFVKECG
jgi:hypothetical protein